MLISGKIITSNSLTEKEYSLKTLYSSIIAKKHYIMYDSKEETQKHINRVKDFLLLCIHELEIRAELHDKSKLENPEKEYFDIYTPLLAEMTFGSPEYTESVKLLKPALDHHYANNSHHPQHYENGINGMDLFDVIEMLMDWRASTERGKDGDIRKSLDINSERFGISKQLKSILLNTINNMKL